MRATCSLSAASLKYWNSRTLTVCGNRLLSSSAGGGEKSYCTSPVLLFADSSSAGFSACVVSALSGSNRTISGRCRPVEMNRMYVT